MGPEVTTVAADEGDLTIFAANSSAVQGADFKHGAPRRCHKAASGPRCGR